MRTAAGQATRHVRPAGSECEDAALEEAPAPLSQAPASAARLLQHASKSSTPMPIMPHVHRHAEHNATTKPLNATQQVGCSSTRAARCFAANASARRAATPRRRTAARGVRTALPC